MRSILFMAMLATLAATASAQVFKCTDGAGKTQFSDKPCAAHQNSSTVRIFKGQQESPSPTTPQAYEEKRQQRRTESNESHQRIDTAQNEVQRIKRENADPQKCASARRAMALMETRYPLMFKFEPSYFEHQQNASLYCGN